LDVNGATYVRNVIYGYAGAGNQYGGLSWNSTDDGFLFLKSANVTKVNINSNGNSYFNGGNVGIGTTSPLSLSTNTKSLTINSTRNDLTGALFFRANNSSKAQFYWDSSGLVSDTISGAARWYTGSTERMRITSAGNVGIGTTSPTHLLNLSESDSNSVQLVIDNTNTTDAGTETSEIRFRHYRSYVPGQNDAGEIIVGKEQAWDQTDHRDSYMAFGTRNGSAGVVEKMRITSSGNVGIGTTSPQQKLHIVDPDGANIILNSNTGAEDNGIWMTEGGVATPYVNGAYVHYDSTNNVFKINTGTSTLSTRFEIARDTGAIKFNNYNSTNNTGTPTYLLGTDASGNVVKTNTVPGSGAGPYLPLSAGSSYPLTGDLYLDDGSGASPSIYLKNGSDNYWRLINGSTGILALKEGTTDKLTFAAGGNATFAGAVTINGVNDTYNFKALATDTDSWFGVYEDANNSANIALIRSDSNESFKVLGHQGNMTVGYSTSSHTINGTTTFAGSITTNLSSEGTYFTGGSGGIRQLSITSGTNSSAHALHTFNIASTNGKYEFDVNGTTELSLDSSSATFENNLIVDGNVGIGDTGPNVKLQVSTSSLTNNVAALIGDGWVGNSSYHKEGGLLLISGTSQDATQTGAGIAFQTRNTQNTNYWKSSMIMDRGGAIRFTLGGAGTVAGSEDFTILSGGNVGIGVTSPAQKLHVGDGGIRVEKFATGLGGFISVGNATESTGNYSAYFFGNTASDTSYFKGGIAYETLASTYGRGDMHFLQNSTTAVANVTISDSVMTILNGGNVGIGTTSPAEKLSLPDNAKIGLGSSADLQIYHDATNSVISNSTGHLYIKTTVADKDIIFEASNGAGSVESYLEIDSDQQDIKVNKRIEMTGTGSAGGQHTIEFNPGTSAIGYIYHDDTNFNVRAIKASSDLVLEATHGNVQILNGNGSGTEVGVMIEQYIAHIGDTDTKFGFTAANQFQVIAGGNTNLNVQGNGVDLSYAGSTRLTTQTGGIAITGDLTVTAEVGIGLTNPDVPLHVTANEDGSGIDKGSAKFINTNTGQGATTMHMVQTSSSNFANAVKFWQGSTPTAVGFIRLTTSATQFITSASDLNLKKNITNWSDDTLSKFKALEPKKFRFKTQDVSEGKTLGFIAQNEVDNFPEAYPQFLGDDEQPYYGFNPTGMVPHLMKAIKDLVEKVETLENRITQLENNN